MPTRCQTPDTSGQGLSLQMGSTDFSSRTLGFAMHATTLLLQLTLLLAYLQSAFPETISFEDGSEILQSPVTLGPQQAEYEMSANSNRISDEHVEGILLEQLSSDSIRNFSRFLSAEPHLAGSKRDEELVEYIKAKWIEFGLDFVRSVPYDVILSYPDNTRPNKVHIVREDGKVLFTSISEEQPAASDSNIVSAFNGYAPPGDVIGDPVYVNYAREEDFNELDKLGIDVKGKICIARYGRTFRGNKALSAAARGAIGLILYIDPWQMEKEEKKEKEKYKRNTPLYLRTPRLFRGKRSDHNSSSDLYSGLWVPGSAIQRGGLFTREGDPLTPGYPSLADVYRLNITDTDLPKIPVQPIGYDDASTILRIMGGPDAPSSWTGALNIKYKLGPGFNKWNAGKKVRLVVNNRYEKKTIHNVVGILKGASEPDRYVIAGNHRDSWVYGAVDASSGTAALLELTRVMGDLKKQGWRPKRTIVFCSWAAEEYGLIGSQEWVEENILKLQSRAVSYANVDICVSGTQFMPEASPLLSNVMLSAMKKIPSSPKSDFNNLFEEWQAHQKKEEKRVPILTGGTDHVGFAFYAGVPSFNFGWMVDRVKHRNVTFYPAYHTVYDNFDLVDRFIDPGFEFHRRCSALLGMLIKQVADADLLPFGVEDLVEDIQTRLNHLINSEERSKLQRFNITLDKIHQALQVFSEEAARWRQRVKALNLHDSFIRKMLNDQLMQVERAFILPQGTPRRPLQRHLMYGIRVHNTYAPGFLPAFYDLLHGIDRLDSAERSQRLKELDKLVSDIMIAIFRAAAILRPPEQL